MGTLYENIESLCSKAGIKGGKMCNDLGMSRGFLTDLKMGRKQSATAETLKKIADYFGVTVDEVVSGEKKNPADMTISEVDAEVHEILEELKDRTDMRMLLHAARNSTPEQIRAVADMLESFKQQ